MPDRSGRGAVLVAAGIAASRVAGLARELLITFALGLSPAADALRAAAKLPNLLQNLLGEGVLSASFIPVYSRMLEEDEPAAAKRTAAGVLGLLSLASGMGALLVIVAARPLTAVLAPGLSGDRYELTISLTRIVAVGVAFLVPSAWCLGVLNSHRRFFVSYVAPVAWNLVQIVVLAAVALRGWSEADAAEAAAWALAAGGVAQLVVQLPWVRRVTGRIRPRIDLRDPGVRATVRRFGPAIVGRGASQLLAFIDLWLASLLATGAIAALMSAQVLYLLPISLFAMSVAAAELPELSRLGEHDPSALAARTGRGLRRILVPVTYAAVLYVVAGRVVTAALFERGEFTADDTVLVGTVLAGFGLALVPAAASRLLQNALYALGEVAATARISVLRLAIAAIGGAILMFPLDRLYVLDGSITGFFELPAPFGPLPSEIREDPTLPLRLGAVGLALGAAMGAWVELAMLRRRLELRLGGRHLLGPAGWALGGVSLLTAAVAVALVALTPDLAPLLRLVVVAGPTGVVHLTGLHLTGVDDWTAPILRRLRIRDRHRADR